MLAETEGGDRTQHLPWDTKLEWLQQHFQQGSAGVGLWGSHYTDNLTLLVCCHPQRKYYINQQILI